MSVVQKFENICVDLRAWLSERQIVEGHPELVTWFEHLSIIDTAGIDFSVLLALHKSKKITKRFSEMLLILFHNSLMDISCSLITESCKLAPPGIHGYHGLVSLEESDVFMLKYMEVDHIMDQLIRMAKKEIPKEIPSVYTPPEGILYSAKLCDAKSNIIIPLLIQMGEKKIPSVFTGVQTFDTSACTNFRAWLLEHQIGEGNPEWITWFECLSKVESAGNDIVILLAMHESAEISNRFSEMFLTTFCKFLKDIHTEFTKESSKLRHLMIFSFSPEEEADFLRNVSQVILILISLIRMAKKEIPSVPYPCKN